MGTAQPIIHIFIVALYFSDTFMQPICWTFMTTPNCAGRKATKGHQAEFEAAEEEEDLLPAQEAWEGQVVLPISGTLMPRISGGHQLFQAGGCRRGTS